MTQRLERLNVNAMNSSGPPPSCEICGSIDHLIENRQVGRSFAQHISNQVNYVNNFNSRSINDHYSNIYNPAWRGHPNFSYRPNRSTMPQMNARQALGFQRPFFSQQAPQKSNLEAIMDSMLLAQQK